MEEERKKRERGSERGERKEEVRKEGEFGIRGEEEECGTNCFPLIWGRKVRREGGRKEGRREEVSSEIDEDRGRRGEMRFRDELD